MPKTTTICKIVNGKLVRCDDSPPPKSQMTAMLKSRRFPCTKTDVEFFKGHGTLADQFEGDDRLLTKTIELAKAQGYTPNPNDVYIPTLAERPGDPKAFVPATGGRNHVRRLCESRGWSCEGDVEVEGVQHDPGPATPLGDDLVAEEVGRRIMENPGLASKPVSDLRDEVIDKHGAK